VSDYPEQESRGIDARDVRPGDVVWNPYGGARGRGEVTSEARERADGTVEFDCADGRTGHFFPHSRLRLDRAAMARRDAERAAAAPGRDMPSSEVPAGPAEVAREYRDAAGSLSAAELEAPDGARFTVRRPQGSVSGADPQVWARPEAYGLERFFCPGHGGSDVCPYAAHDEIRYPGFGRVAQDAEREAGQ
jgi:hypothetical protein